jgi:hypothetical protein
MRGLWCSFWLVIVLAATQAPVALASDGWCDTDPILVIHTPAGNLVPVFVTVGAQSLLFTPNTLLGSLAVSYTAVPTGDGTATSVTVNVSVPPSPLAQSFATRDAVSTGAFGSGTVYARATGVSGTTTTSRFQLPYR